MAGPVPRTELETVHWTPAERAEFLRRRRGRNILLLVALGGLCLVLYAIVMVKLHEYGTMW